MALTTAHRPDRIITPNIIILLTLIFSKQYLLLLHIAFLPLFNDQTTLLLERSSCHFMHLRMILLQFELQLLLCHWQAKLSHSHFKRQYHVHHPPDCQVFFWPKGASWGSYSLFCLILEEDQRSWHLLLASIGQRSWVIIQCRLLRQMEWVICWHGPQYLQISK